LLWWFDFIICDVFPPTSLIFFCFFSTKKSKERNEGKTTLAAVGERDTSSEVEMGNAAEI